MKIAVTPAEYAELTVKLVSTKGVIFVPAGPNGGTITTSDVTLSYLYDGTGEVDVEVTEKHSFLARHAPESVIESHITQIFAESLA